MDSDGSIDSAGSSEAYLEDNIEAGEEPSRNVLSWSQFVENAQLTLSHSAPRRGE